MYRREQESEIAICGICHIQSNIPELYSFSFPTARPGRFSLLSQGSPRYVQSKIKQRVPALYVLLILYYALVDICN